MNSLLWPMRLLCGLNIALLLASLHYYFLTSLKSFLLSPCMVGYFSNLQDSHKCFPLRESFPDFISTTVQCHNLPRSYLFLNNTYMIFLFILFVSVLIFYSHWTMWERIQLHSKHHILQILIKLLDSFSQAKSSSQFLKEKEILK